jgi:hypothetical protein
MGSVSTLPISSSCRPPFNFFLVASDRDLGYVTPSRNVYNFRVFSSLALRQKIIPFFEKHTLCSTKKFDFLRFSQVDRLKANMEHLSSQGKIKINNIRQVHSSVLLDSSNSN